RPEGRRFRSRGARDPGKPAVLAFSIDLGGVPVAEGDRARLFGGLKKLAEKARIYVFRFAANWVADQGVRFLERGVERGVLDLRAGGDPADPDTWARLQGLGGLALPPGRPARVLLLVHGTFSSTVGSYGALCHTAWGRSFLGHADAAYDAILGFDHPTLSESPGENAIELLRLLKSAPWGEPPRIDAVGYSRGGLVLRSLVEQVLPSDGWAARVER